MPRPLLLLDLDETLFHAALRPLGREADVRVGAYHVYRRPHVEAFLQQVAERFEVAVWTSATPGYARAMLEALLPAGVVLSFVWARDRCTRRFDVEAQTTEWIKDLKKVKRRGYDPARILIVDDRAEPHVRQYGNLVRVRPFTGDPADEELLHLARYLASLAGVENVRRVEKRGWRTRCHDGRSSGARILNG